MDKKLQKRLNRVAGALEKMAAKDTASLRAKYKSTKVALEKAKIAFDNARSELISALTDLKRED